MKEEDIFPFGRIDSKVLAWAKKELTVRERQVWLMDLAGKSAKETAAELQMTPSAVTGARQRVTRKRRSWKTPKQ